MRICLFSAQYLPSVGGVERYTYYLAKQLSSMGHTVTVVTSSSNGLPDQEIRERIEVVRLPSLQLMGGRLPLLKPSGELKEFGRYFQKAAFDGAVIQTRFYPLSLKAAQLCKKYKVPAVVIDHGSAHLGFSSAPIQLVGNLYEHIITALVKRCHPKFYGVSEESVNWLKHFSVKADGVLYNAVDEQEIERLRNEKEPHFRADHAIPADTAVVLYAGRFIEEKGVMPMIEAVKALRSEGAAIHLLLAGSGPLEEEIKAAEGDGVTLLGRLPFEQVITCLTESDIFCLPSRSEGFSTSALEAAMCDCTIVATRVGGVSAIVKDGESGILLRGMDAASVKEGLQRALTADRAAMCRACRDNIENCGCRWEATAQKVVSIFDTTREDMPFERRVL